MAGVAEKLYPPIIGASIPAFYENNGTAVITVPFSMSRAVSASSVYSFALKIKTAQSNSYITTLYSDHNSTESFIGDRTVSFVWENFNSQTTTFNKIKVGQFLKVQLSYTTTPETVTGLPVTGYFSTVAIVKFTSMPKISIKNMASSNDLNGIPVFRQSYTGAYEVTEDKNERPYAYNFYLYDNTKKLIEESGWQLHNNSVNTIASESLQISETTDSYQFNSSLISNTEYYIQYGVRTINNLEVYSPMYTCIEYGIDHFDLNADLIASNIFEEGYIQLSFKRKNVNDVVISQPISIEISRAEVGYADLTDLNAFSWKALKKMYFAEGTDYDVVEAMSFKDYTVEQGVRYLYCFKQYNSNNISSTRVISNLVEADFEDMFLYDGKLQLKIRFNPKVGSFKITRQEQKIDTIGSRFPFMFRNGIVEYKEFPIGGLISYLADNNKEFFKDEEDLNIIRGNDATRTAGTPIFTYQYTQIDSSIVEEDYLPGRYYLSVNGEYKPAMNLLFSQYQAGTIFYSRERIIMDNRKPWETSETLDSIGYNMRAERRFKLKLLEWLGDGKIKLFRSPAEGNYLVKLMNVSLTPEDKLGRMIHSFQATAYEVEELNYKNLLELGFINVDNYEKEKIIDCSIRIADKIEEMDDITASIRLNSEIIANYLRISPAQNTESNTFIVRIGGDNSRCAVIDTRQFEIIAEGELPNVWFNISDNIQLSENLALAFNSVTDPVSTQEFNAFPAAFRNSFTASGRALTKKNLVIAAAEDLVGDAIFYYGGLINVVEFGDIGDIENIYVRNQIGSIIGPGSIVSHSVSSGGTQEQDILQYYVLNFLEKQRIEIYQDTTNNRYYLDSTLQQRITRFDLNTLYYISQITNGNIVQNYNVLKYSTNSTSLNRTIDLTNAAAVNQANTITLSLYQSDNQNQTIVYKEVPQLDLKNNYFTQISIGAFYQLDYAYQEKITEKISS